MHSLGPLENQTHSDPVWSPTLLSQKNEGAVVLMGLRRVRVGAVGHLIICRRPLIKLTPLQVSSSLCGVFKVGDCVEASSEGLEVPYRDMRPLQGETKSLKMGKNEMWTV